MKMLSERPCVAGDAFVRDSMLGRYTEVAAGAQVVESELGDYSYVMERSDIIYTTIGKFSNIASDVRINPGNHPMEWVSQHHFLYRRRQYALHEEDHGDFFTWRRMQRVAIGHDTWVGTKAVIMPGVHVGNGAVVGSGAVVTRDVAPYTIVAGVPAKPIRTRFPEKIWQQLEAVSWWHWDHEQLRECLDDFYDIRRFLARHGNMR